MKSYYQISISGKKWWTRLLFDLIDKAIYNSLVLHNESPNHGRQSLKAFRLAKELIGCFSSHRKRGRASLEQPRTELYKGIFPLLFQSMKVERGWKGDVQFVQQTKKKRKETSSYCPDCDVGLCAALCFRIYHEAE